MSAADLADIDFLKPLARDIFLAEAPNQARFPFCNGFLFIAGQTVLIDAGIGRERIEAIDKCLRIDILIISHSHPDHILAWHLLQDRHLLMPAETPPSFKSLQEMGLRFTGSEEYSRHWVRQVGNVLGLRPLREPDGRFADGERIQVGGLQLEAIHTPGHLCDHYCFLEHTSQTLLSTDIDLTAFGPWYGNPEGDVERFRKDVEKIRRLPFRRVCSSHKAPICHGADDSFQTYLAAFERQKQAVLALCNPTATIADLVAQSPFYKNKLPDKIIQRIFETNMIQENIKVLLKEGRLEEINGGYQRKKG